MGSSESKITAAAPLKPEPANKLSRVGYVMDPRSPSADISRTPIQVGYPVNLLPDLLKALAGKRLKMGYLYQVFVLGWWPYVQDFSCGEK